MKTVEPNRLIKKFNPIKFSNEISNPLNVKCKLGDIDKDGIPKSFKTNMYEKLEEHYLDLDLLCVIHDMKPICSVSNTFDITDVQKQKRRIINDLAIKRGLKGFQVSTSNTYIVSYPNNYYVALMLAIFWIHSDKCETIYNKSICKQIDKLHKNRISSLSDIDVKTLKSLPKYIANKWGDIIQGILLGYGKDGVYGWTLRGYFNHRLRSDNIEINDFDDKQWMIVAQKYFKQMTTKEQENFDIQFEKLYKWAKNKIITIFVSKDFKKLARMMEPFWTDKAFKC